MQSAQNTAKYLRNRLTQKLKLRGKDSTIVKKISLKTKFIKKKSTMILKIPANLANYILLASDYIKNEKKKKKRAHNSHQSLKTENFI